MKTEKGNGVAVGQVWSHRKNGSKVTIIKMNKEVVLMEDEKGSQRDTPITNLKKTYKLTEEVVEKKTKAKKEDKPAKTKGDKKEKAAKKGDKKAKEETQPEAKKRDKIFDDVVNLMKKHNKKDVEALLSVVVVFHADNYTEKYTTAQRSYRLINNQPSLMPKAAVGEPVIMFSLAGDDDPVDYNLYNYKIESAYVEFGDDDEELPDYNG